MLGTRLGSGAQLRVLVGMLVQRQQAAGDRVARGVVAADDQQDQVAEVRPPAACPRVAGECASIDIRSLLGGAADPLVPQPREVGEALAQFGSRRSPTTSTGPVCLGLAGGHVGPPGEQPPVLEREVEQRGQHLRGQLDRDALDPVEGLAERQAVEDPAARSRIERLQPREVGRRDDRRSRSCAARRASAGPSR